jgi:hypothetical protein
MLQVFHRLVSSKTFDGEGFHILQTLIESPQGVEMLTPHLKQVFQLIFMRLTKGRTPKFCKHLIVFCSHVAVKFTPQVLIDTFDGLQASLFGLYLDRVVALDLTKVMQPTKVMNEVWSLLSHFVDSF